MYVKSMGLNNKKNKDESINSFQDTGIPGAGYSVPFSNPNFLDQIEQYILPAVLTLNLKGYPTVTSCHGHGVFNYIFNHGVSINTGPSITVRIDKDSANKLKKHFNTFFIKSVINDSMEKQDSLINLKISSRFIISNFFSNRFLCNKIIELSEKCL